ncbi:MAG: radical SAM protein [Desulfobulbaceae bacterium]|nr:radical SAM protein [Desulfobulbaceae bacterium]
MNHIFGPVNSRRLGRSLGIDILPRKICNFDCIYCEVGPTTQLVCERQEYVPTESIIAEVEEYFADPTVSSRIDVVTVTASGEPTLHSGLGRIIRFLKERTGKPVAVLTNGTNLGDKEVAAALSQADVVIPSLDTVLSTSFRKLNRPAKCVDLDEMIEGLIQFTNGYEGELWLEILLARGFNDSKEDIEALMEVIRRMKLSRVQLNTVARPPHEKFALPVEQDRLKEIAEQLSKVPGVPRVEIITYGMSGFEKGREVAVKQPHFSRPDDEKLVDEILQMLKRRPCTAVDIDRTFFVGGPEKVERLLEPLVHSGAVEKQHHGDKVFYH